MIRICIVDDHPMVIEGIKMLLAHARDLQVSGTASDAYQALEMIRSDPPDVVLVDINLPEISGIDLCHRIKSQFPSVRVLGISTFHERSYITRMMEAGASGYLLKNASQEELEEAIQMVAKGRTYLSMEMMDMLTRQDPKPGIPLLTTREKEVLALIADGFTNPEIASKLFISQLTVDSHRKNLLAKFGVKNTAAMVKFALEWGLLG